THSSMAARCASVACAYRSGEIVLKGQTSGRRSIGPMPAPSHASLTFKSCAVIARFAPFRFLVRPFTQLDTDELFALVARTRSAWETPALFMAKEIRSASVFMA